MQSLWSNSSLPIPFVKESYLPIVGHFIPFLRDRSKFLLKCQRLYGSRFVIQIFSQRMIFLLDPCDWPAINRNVNLSLPARDISTKLFGLRPEFINDKETQDEFHRFNKQYLQSTQSLGSLISRFVKCVRETMMHDRANIGVRRWQECGLLELSHHMIFEASGRTLFGDINPLVLEKSFSIFDKNIHYFVASLPQYIQSLFLRREIHARNQIAAYFDSHPHAPNESEFVRHRASLILEKDDRKPNDLGRFQTTIFWASVANTIPATFWSLFYILQDRNALEKINEEIRTHLPPFSLSDCNDPNINLWTYDAIAKCVYLESAINETLRLKGAPMVHKSCTQDTVIQLADDRVLPIKKDDSVFLFPEATHYNEHYFSEPDSYKFDRFIGKTTDTIKGLLPFGTGKTMCPGRHFSKGEIKVCLALILYLIEYEFIDANAKPNIQKSRIGFGIAIPDHDVSIRYRYKQ
ncbi:unnamed protein product [Rotaria sp. Silwood1]|nr:unnamed protein product [Rotaria sp. Silwood1]CAF1369306.1 unnamed protein product [Rotaria sp. Silwood1]